MRWGRWIVVGATCLAGGIATVLYLRRSGKCADEKKTGARASLKPSCNKQEKGVRYSKQLKDHGNELFKNANYQEALEAFTNAIEACPETEKQHLAICYQNRAATYDRLDNAQQSFIDCNSALKFDPCYTKAIIRRARACVAASRPEDALKDFVYATLVDPSKTEILKAETDTAVVCVTKNIINKMKETRKSIPVRDELVLLWRSAFTNDPVLSDLNRRIGSSAGMYSEALEAIRTQDYENVMPKLEEDLRRSQLSALDALKDLVFLGRIAAIKEDVETLEKSLDRFSKVWMELGEDAKSAEEYRHLRCLHHLLSAALMMQLDKSNFTAEIQKAVDADPENPDVYVGAALLFLERTRPDDAIRFLDRTISTHPKKGLVRHMRANCELALKAAQGDVGGAIAAMGKVHQILEEGSADPVLYLATGRLFYAAQNKELAKEFFVKAANGLPDHAAPLLYLAVMQAESMEGSPEQLPVLQEQMAVCLEKEKNNPDALAILAKIAYQMRKLEEAERLYSQCIEICPIRTDENAALPAVTDFVQIRALREAVARYQAATSLR